MTRRAFPLTPLRTLAIVAVIVLTFGAALTANRADATPSDGLTPAHPVATQTAGEFLLQYARAIHLQLPANATPETALAAIRASGSLLQFDVALDRTLTHGDLVRIGRANGLKVSSNTPDRVVTRDEAALFLDAFARFLTPLPAAGQDQRVAADSNGSQAGDHANTDKGKKKGRPFQCPSEPRPEDE